MSLPALDISQMPPDPVPRQFSHHCPATLDQASNAVVAVMDALRDWDVDWDMEPVLADVELALAEAVTNVVKHAYDMTDDGWIRLNCHEGDGSLSIHVLDGGQALPDGFAPKPDMPDMDVVMLDLPEGGFGWPLILALASRVSHHRRMGVNRLILTFRNAESP